MELTQYTFTFNNEDEWLFRRILERLSPEEYNVIEDIRKIVPVNHYHKQSEMQAIIEMESISASTFRFGMENLKIKKLRTAEEEAERKAIEDRNKVVIKVKVDGLNVI